MYVMVRQTWNNADMCVYELTSESHVGPPFVAVFSQVLSMLRQLFQTTDPTSQPFVVSGSGTLGWDMVAANLVEGDDEVLVLHTGYFADSFADCFETYGIKATQLKAAIGSRPGLSEIEHALKQRKYKIITVTHVDTSTGVLSEIQSLAEMVHRVSPETLVVVDGVCSVGVEELRFDEWGLDVVLTASQKGIGCPAGLSILMTSGRAMEVFKNRKTSPSSYYASFKNWLPSKAPPYPSSLTFQSKELKDPEKVMKNYEAKKPSYFATPSPQLIHALHASLTQILSMPPSTRFSLHRSASERVKATISQELGLKQLATDPANQANGMTAFYVPDHISVLNDLLPKLTQRGAILAAGLHRDIKTKYARIGHMGVTVLDPNRKGELDRALVALREVLVECGYEIP